MAAGNFDATAVGRLTRRVDRDARANINSAIYDPSTEVIKAVVANDTSTFKEPMLQRNNCVGVTVGWMEANVPAQVVGGYTEHRAFPCTITGPMAQTFIQSYILDHYVVARFSLPEERCENIYSFEEEYNTLALQANRSIRQQIALYILTNIHGFAGVNKYLPGDDNIGVAVTNNASLTDIARGNMNALDAVWYFLQSERVNKMLDSYILDGSVFGKQRWFAEIGAQAGIAVDLATNIAFAQRRIFSDVANFELAGMPDTMFQISRGALALAFKSVVEGVENITDEMIRYTEQLGGDLGTSVTKDCYMQRSKVPVTNQAGDCMLYRNFEHRVPLGLFLNPSLSTDVNGSKGVLEYHVNKTLTAKKFS